MFSDPLKPFLFENFLSKIERETYEETKKVLQKKEYQSRSLMNQKEIGCCGMIQTVKFKHIC